MSKGHNIHFTPMSTKTPILFPQSSFHHPSPPHPGARSGVGARARLVVVEVPVDGEAVAADAPLLAGGAGTAPPTHAHIAPCPQQLWRLLWLQPRSTWKTQDGVKGMDEVWMDRRLPVTVGWLGQKSLLCSALVQATIPQTHKQTTFPDLLPWTSISPDHWFTFPQRRLLIHNYCIHPCCYLDKTSSPGNLSTLLAFP